MAFERSPTTFATLTAVSLVVSAAGVLVAHRGERLSPPASTRNGRVRDGRQPIALRDLVTTGDPLASQDLRFDARFAEAAIQSLETAGPASVERLATLPATAHLLNHARQFDYEVPKDSPAALLRYLLSPTMAPATRLPTAKRSLAFFMGPMLDDPRWVHDALSYLPPTFRFRGTLFLTFGYDIGVALAPNASLNGAHSHFDGHPRELLYYAIHELHHVGFMTYQPPPRVADLETCGDVLRLVEYSTQLEGMAVLAARARRAGDQSVQDDADYVALEDVPLMDRLEAQFFQHLEYLGRRGNAPVDADARAVLEEMSSRDRLWYRVGARMAASVEQILGREALVALVSQRPPALVRTYRDLRARRERFAMPAPVDGSGCVRSPHSPH